VRGIVLAGRELLGRCGGLAPAGRRFRHRPIVGTLPLAVRQAWWKWRPRRVSQPGRIRVEVSVVLDVRRWLSGRAEAGRNLARRGCTSDIRNSGSLRVFPVYRILRWPRKTHSKALKLDRPDSSSMATELGKLVVDQHLATEEEVEKCLALQLKAARADSGLRWRRSSSARASSRPARWPASSDPPGQQVQQIPGYQILAKLGSGRWPPCSRPDSSASTGSSPSKSCREGFPKTPTMSTASTRKARRPQSLTTQHRPGHRRGRGGGYHYFVMEYVEGRTLGDDLEAGRVMTRPRRWS